MPQMGALATQNISAEPDVTIGDKVRTLATRKGASLVSSFVNLGIFVDAAVNAQQARFIDELDNENELFLGALGYLFNGATLDRQRGLGTVALDGLGQASVSPAVPGASVVRSEFHVINSSTTRQTIVTPTAGKRIRIIAAFGETSSGTATNLEFYFGTGANIQTDETKVIWGTLLDLVDFPADNIPFPDGGGPVGAVNDVVSARSTVSVAPDTVFGIIYREE